MVWGLGNTCVKAARGGWDEAGKPVDGDLHTREGDSHVRTSPLSVPQKTTVRGDEEMSLIATYQLDTPVYDSLFEAVPDLRFEIEQVVACSPDTLSVTVWAETDHWTRFETHLERSETVKASQYLRSEDDRELYQVWLPASETSYWDWTALGGVLLSATATRQGATVRMEFPDHEALSAYRDWCLEQNRKFSLNSLTVA